MKRSLRVFTVGDEGLAAHVERRHSLREFRDVGREYFLGLF